MEWMVQMDENDRVLPKAVSSSAAQAAFLLSCLNNVLLFFIFAAIERKSSGVSFL